jgi:intracellular multiplication protein IcmE
MFGVLDTAINTDEKGPVMASIVHGKYKGTKLLGNIEHNGFAEKAIIRFDRVSIPKRLESLGAEIVAIDPDTARTALASDVDRHYLLRYGSLFASSFMEGFGEAISQQGTTTTAADGSTQQTKPKLTGKDQIYSALGNVGSQWATQAAPLFNTPYTVTVDQGVGMGLLFLNDLDVTPKEE